MSAIDAILVYVNPSVDASKCLPVAEREGKGESCSRRSFALRALLLPTVTFLACQFNSATIEACFSGTKKSSYCRPLLLAGKLPPTREAGQALPTRDLQRVRRCS